MRLNFFASEIFPKLGQDLKLRYIVLQISAYIVSLSPKMTLHPAVLYADHD